MENKKYLWITPLLILVMISGGQYLLSPTTDGYDVCRHGKQYGVWENISETIYVNDNLSALGYYKCSIEQSNRWCGKVSGSRCYYVLDENITSGFEFMLEPIITDIEGYREYHNVLEPAKTKLKDINVKDIIPKNKPNLDWSNIENMSDTELNTYLLQKGTYLKHDYQLDEVLIMYDKKIKKLEQLIERAQYQEEKNEYIIDINKLKEKQKAVLLEKQIRDTEAFYRNPVGTTYYIDCDNGDDGAAGTSTGTAWKTISKFTEDTIRSAGDIGIVRANTTCVISTAIDMDEDGTTDNYIELQGASSTNDPWSDGLDIKPIINGNGTTGNMYINLDDYWRVTNFNMLNTANTNGMMYVRSSYGTVLDNLILNQSMTSIRSIYFSSTYTLSINNTFVSGSNDPCIYTFLSTVISKNDKFIGYDGMGSIGGSIVHIINGNLTQISRYAAVIEENDEYYFENCVFNPSDTLDTIFSFIDYSIFGMGCVDYFNGQIVNYCEDRGTEYSSNSSITNPSGSTESLKLHLNSYSLRNNNTYYGFHMFDRSIKGDFNIYTTTGSQTISMWARAQDWTTVPNSNNFYLRARYLDNATTMHRAEIRSVQSFSDNDYWQEFNITINPLQDGFVYLDFINNLQESGAEIFIDIKPVVS